MLAAAGGSWLQRLGEVADLFDKQLITADEFVRIKNSLLAQIRAAAQA